MKELLKKRYFKAIVLVELAIMLFLLVNCFTKLDTYNVPYSQLQYIYGEVIDGEGIQVTAESGMTGYFAYSPYVNLKKGNYDITVHYHTESLGTSVEASGFNGNYNSIKMDKVILNPLLDKETFCVCLDKDIQNFSVYIIYDGAAFFTIKDITISENVSGRIYQFLETGIFFLLLNVVMWVMWLSANGRVNKEKAGFVLILTGIVLFASYPLFTTFLTDGDDLPFHLLRIEGIKDGLLDGQFPVRIHPTQFRGYGYASSIFYGELFLYIPAVLRLCGLTLQDAYKVFLLMFNIVTALVSYKCFEGILKNKKIALVCCAVYVLAPYRLTNMYVRSALGELCAMTFWPIIALGLYRLFTEDVTSKKYKNIWIYLTIGYTGVIQTHLLSCEIAAAVSVILCLILIKKVFRKNTMIELVKFFVATVLLNAYFLIPFIDYMLKGGVLVADHGSLQTSAIQGNGIYPAQLFNLFVNGSGMAYGHGVEAYRVLGMYQEMGTTVGLPLMIALGGFIYLSIVYYKQVHREKLFIPGVLMSIAGILSLYMSTNVFPWDSLCRRFGSLVYNLQFPWRMLSVSTIFLTIVFGCTLVLMQERFHEKSYQKFIVVVLAINIFTSGYMMYDKLNTSKAVFAYDTVALANRGSGSLNEYLLSETEPGALTAFNPIATENVFVTDYVKEYTDISFYATEKENLPGVVTVPLLAYEGYAAKDDDGNKLMVSKNDNGVLTVEIPASYDGEVNVYYAGEWYWHVAEIISAITLIIFLVLGLKSVKRPSDIKND